MSDKVKFVNAVNDFAKARIAVIGDLMLDVYHFGTVTRISPEAPVPVVSVTRRTHCLGGAGNVMRNIVSCGGSVHAFGAVGDDQAGREVVSELQALGVDHSGIVTDGNKRTTEKCRVIAGSQQMLRLDYEDVLPLADDLRKSMVGGVKKLIGSGAVDAVIFDDYAKGVLTASMLEEIIAAAGKRRIVTLLDPKPASGGVTTVKHLTVLKPNRGEAFTLARMRDPGPAANPLQDNALKLAANKISEEWDPEYLLISLAAQGMALFRRGDLLRIIPAMAREVFDVSGAGDTVAAVCTMALACGCDPVDAAKIANIAAGVVVGKIGTAPIFKEELLAAFEHAVK